MPAASTSASTVVTSTSTGAPSAKRPAARLENDGSGVVGDVQLRPAGRVGDRLRNHEHVPERRCSAMFPPSWARASGFGSNASTRPPSRAGGHGVEPDVRADVDEVAAARGAGARGRARGGRRGRRGSRAGATRAGRAGAAFLPGTSATASPGSARAGRGAAGPSRGSPRGGTGGRRLAPARSEANLSRRDRGPLHLRRPARRHRHRLRAAPARRRSRPTRTRSRPRSTTPTATRSSRASTTPATSPRSASSSREHDVKLVVPLTDLDQLLLARAPRRARRARAAPRRRGRRAASATSTSRTASSRSAGIPSPPSWLPDEVPGRPRVPGARQGAARLRLAPHLPRARPRELDFFLGYTPVESFVQQLCPGEEFSIDVFCDLDGRCLNAIPRTMIESKGGESIKGMTIKDGELIEFGRRVAETLGDRRARRTSSASARPTAATRSPTSTRASAAASRCRSPPAAATRSSRSRWRAASGPSRASATSARAS